MGKEKKVVMAESKQTWPFEIVVNLRPTLKTPIAFMSSQSRTYFPEDPGVSRFGIYYSMNCAASDVPNPKYFPSDNRLQKPISTKGFGIGGLTGPRFLNLHLAANPAPNAYQNEISTRQVKTKAPSESKKKKKKNGKAHEEEKPAEAPPPPPIVDKNSLRQLCLQKVVGFGAHLSVPRFGRESKFKNVGVGYYNLNRCQAVLGKSGSFGLSPVVVVPPTITRCNYRDYDKCFGCEAVLSMVDYYRTRMKIPDPTLGNRELARIGTTEEERLTPDKNRAALLVDNTTSQRKTKLIHVSLCRKCYCKGMRGECKFWNRTQILWLFQKTRHCSYIHDHQNFPEFVHKTSCKFVRKVQLKETLMAKYYKDACERILKQK